MQISDHSFVVCHQLSASVLISDGVEKREHGWPKEVLSAVGGEGKRRYRPATAKFSLLVLQSVNFLFLSQKNFTQPEDAHCFPFCNKLYYSKLLRIVFTTTFATSLCCRDVDKKLYCQEKKRKLSSKFGY